MNSLQSVIVALSFGDADNPSTIGRSSSVYCGPY